MQKPESARRAADGRHDLLSGVPSSRHGAAERVRYVVVGGRYRTDTRTGEMCRLDHSPRLRTSRYGMDEPSKFLHRECPSVRGRHLSDHSVAMLARSGQNEGRLAGHRRLKLGAPMPRRVEAEAAQHGGCRAIYPSIYKGVRAGAVHHDVVAPADRCFEEQLRRRRPADIAGANEQHGERHVPSILTTDCSPEATKYL